MLDANENWGFMSHTAATSCSFWTVYPLPKKHIHCHKLIYLPLAHSMGFEYLAMLEYLLALKNRFQSLQTFGVDTVHNLCQLTRIWGKPQMNSNINDLPHILMVSCARLLTYTLFTLSIFEKSYVECMQMWWHSHPFFFLAFVCTVCGYGSNQAHVSESNRWFHRMKSVKHKRFRCFLPTEYTAQRVWERADLSIVFVINKIVSLVLITE